MVQWLRFHASTAGDMGLIPNQELRSHIPCGMSKKKKKKEKPTDKREQIFLRSQG